MRVANFFLKGLESKYLQAKRQNGKYYVVTYITYYNVTI